jgi:hypothetical protein
MKRLQQENDPGKHRAAKHSAGFIANCVDRPKQAEQMTIKTASVLGLIFNAGMVYE